MCLRKGGREGRRQYSTGREGGREEEGERGREGGREGREGGEEGVETMCLRKGGRETVQYIRESERVRWCTHLEEGGDTSLSPAVFVSIILKEQGSNVRMT